MAKKKNNDMKSPISKDVTRLNDKALRKQKPSDAKPAREQVIRYRDYVEQFKAQKNSG